MPEEPLLVICPLQFEMKALAGLRRLGIELACCGPGADAVGRFVEASKRAIRSRVYLAGVAGAISQRVPTGKAAVASEVVNQAGERLTGEAWLSRGSMGMRIVSVEKPAVSVAAKRELHEHSGADLVDCESAAFAAAATSRGWWWKIIRGVSDGPEDELPERVMDWVDAKGRTRSAAAAMAMARRPAIIPAVFRLARQSASAMKEVADLIERIEGA